MDKKSNAVALLTALLVFAGSEEEADAINFALNLLVNPAIWETPLNCASDAVEIFEDFFGVAAKGNTSPAAQTHRALVALEKSLSDFPR